MNRRFVSLVLSAACLLAAAGEVEAAQPPAEPAGLAAIRGAAAYRERIALPPNAVFEATLEDISRADAPAEVIGRARVEPAGQVPIRFEIPYDPSRIKERNSYSVRGRITVDGKLWFTTDQVYPVLTRGYSDNVELTLRRATANAALAGTYWRIVRLGEASVSPTAGRREPHLLLRAEDERKRFAATVGCNQMAGGYSADGEAIRFTQAASTLMACPPPLDALERRLLETLDKTRRWRIKADTLEFFDDAGVPVALFEAVHF